MHSYTIYNKNLAYKYYKNPKNKEDKIDNEQKWTMKQFTQANVE